MTVLGPPGPPGIVVKPVVLAVAVIVTGAGPVANVITVGGPPLGPGGNVVRPVVVAVDVIVTGRGLVTNVIIVSGPP
ncbi:uncharacterized protein BDZ83DRAFT_616020 [Colletotrichum acutatum]|uniref:Uncharacterized protein n=1 Tax=Glomerella acutata TaxID=27357 RepID=A0AAD8UME1_GLOAC|nr:uncharacterized protein BDZ83DRAFT_616020 [Colletotrichum acutatum]KAK1726486.1 hypothetical protein BDZ83DRAFT_616020 [Colletotrichum acutatum]